MAKRYIDADKLIEHLKDNIEECETPNVVNEPVAYGTVLGLECALSYAETLPTADVVEVVRCKDCKYYETHRPIHKKVCEKNEGHLIPMQPDDFCSYGERRKDDDV